MSSTPDAFAGSELDPAASRKRREKLCVRMESLLKELGPAVPKEPAGLDDLAARLKDALASNTMTGGKSRAPSNQWRKAADEANALEKAP